jgi:CheY-like chemotaxis protein
MMTLENAPPSLEVYAPSSHPAPGPLTPVLVVDDEPAGAATTLGWLAGAGYPTAAESAGDAVLRLVRTEVMRLVVSELYIPCGEGACVVTALKQDRTRLPRLRVLVYSRHTAAADDAWALAAGCDALLHKPASAAACVREVRRLDGGEPGEPEPDAADAAGGAP